MTSDLRLAPNDVTGDVILASNSSSSSSDDAPTLDGADVGGNSENIPEGEEERSGGIPSHVIISSAGQQHGNDNRPFVFRNNYRLDDHHLDTRRSFDSGTRFLGEYSEEEESLGLEVPVRGSTMMTSTLEGKILGLRREATLVDEKVRLSRRFFDERQEWMARMAEETRSLRHRALLRTVGGLHHQLTRQSFRLRQTLTDISQPPSHSPAGS